jgi:hypothetical protein
MKKMYILLALCIVFCQKYAHGMADPAPQETNIYFESGPLKLTVPFKTADVVYLYDGLNQRSLVGAETTILTLWDKVSATAGGVTSLQGAGTPFVGLDLALGNTLDRFVNLGPIRLGGFGGRDFRVRQWVAGLKASVLLW